ncbi:MAG: long-chain fatty acid--CoA ligase, partial [Haloarculaceae archaeon]
DIIVSGGENISSIEVEDAIYDHEAVVRAAVVPAPSERWGETPKAFVVLREGATLSEDDLIAFVKERIASYKAPTRVAFVAELPTTATGKVQKYELRKREWQGEDRMVGEG